MSYAWQIMRNSLSWLLSSGMADWEVSVVMEDAGILWDPSKRCLFGLLDFKPWEATNLACSTQLSFGYLFP